MDYFWSDVLKGKEKFENLYNFIKKMVFILSHGQAFVERGFSINKELIVENQVNVSLIAQRRVYDGIKSAGGVHSILVYKRILQWKEQL